MRGIKRLSLIILTLILVGSMSIFPLAKKSLAAPGDWDPGIWEFGTCYYFDIDEDNDSMGVCMVEIRERNYLGQGRKQGYTLHEEHWYWCTETAYNTSTYQCYAAKGEPEENYKCGQGSVNKQYTDINGVTWQCAYSKYTNKYYWVSEDLIRPDCNIRNAWRLWKAGSGRTYQCVPIGNGQYEWVELLQDPFQEPKYTEPLAFALPQFQPNPGTIILDFQHPEEPSPSLLKWDAGSGNGLVSNFRISTLKGQPLFNVAAVTGVNSYSVDVKALTAFDGAGVINDFTINAYKADGTGYYIGSITQAGGDPFVSRASGEFNAVTKHYRVADTRNGLGGKTGPVGSEITDFQVATGGWTSATDSVVLNITVVDPTAASWLTVWESGRAKPAVSNLNYVAGQTVANQVTARVSTTGKISLSNAVGSAHILIDVQGYYSRPEGPSGRRFHPVGPTRVADSRTGQGGLGSVGSCCALAQVITNDITSQHNGSMNGVKAVTINVTVTDVYINSPYTSSYLTAWPWGEADPGVSHINFKPGETVSNQITVPVYSDGKIRLRSAYGSANVIIDLVGYYTGAYPGYDGAYGRYVSVAPSRIMDTRNQIGKAYYHCYISEWSAPRFPSTYCGGGLSMMFGSANQEIPSKYVALASKLSITATGAEASGYLALIPGHSLTGTSNLNYAPDKTVAVAAVATAVNECPNCGSAPPTPHYHLFNSAGKVHVIADMFGFFVKSVQ